MFRKIDVATIAARFFHKGGMLSNQDYFRSLPYRAMKIVNRDLKINKIKIAGVTLHLDDKDSLNLAWHRVYEPYETRLALNLIKPGNTVLDLGAFIGYYTLLFADKLGSKGKVFGFEASPISFSILKKNVEEYNNKRKLKPNEIVTIEDKAITADSNQEIFLYQCDVNNGMNRIYPSIYCKDLAKSYKVKTVRLDDYFQHYTKPFDFVKMDLEGSEFGALEGMKEIINKSKSIKILLEFIPSSIIEYGRDPKELIELLHSYGFIIYHLNKSSMEMEPIRPIVSTMVETRSQLMTSDYLIDIANNNTTNILCIKDSKT